MGASSHYQRNRRGECSPAGKGSEQNEVLCFRRKGFCHIGNQVFIDGGRQSMPIIRQARKERDKCRIISLSCYPD